MTTQSCACTLSECDIAKAHNLKYPDECLAYDGKECAYKIVMFKAVKVHA